MARKDRKRSNIVSVDFSDVQSNILLPQDTGYHFKVEAASSKDNDGDGAILVKLKVLGANNKKSVGKTIQHYFNLGDTSLWVLRNFLDACGVEVPEGPLDIDLDGLVGLEFIADNEHNTYNDRTKNQLTNFMSADGETSTDDNDEDEDDVKVTDKKKSRDEDDEDEDERPSKKAKKKVIDEDDEEDDEDEKPSKKSKKSARDEEDEDDEEDEKPSKKAKKSKDEDEEDEDESAGDEYSEDEIRGMDEKELKSIIKLHKLKVDLDDYPSLRKQSMAVCDALDKKGLLSE